MGAFYGLQIVYFSGKGGSSQKEYHVDLDFLNDIVPEVLQFSLFVILLQFHICATFLTSNPKSLFIVYHAKIQWFKPG